MRACKWKIMTSIGSQESLCATHSAHVHREANTVIILCMLCTLDSNGFASQVDSVCVWHLRVADVRINRTSRCHLWFLMCCHGQSFSWLTNPCCRCLCQFFGPCQQNKWLGLNLLLQLTWVDWSAIL